MRSVYKPEEECSKLAENIGRICEARGLSTYTVAEKAGVSRTTLNDLLNGKNRPQLYTLYKICNALEISILELFRTNEEWDSKNVKEEENLEKEFSLIYRYLSPWKKSRVREYMRMLVAYEEEGMVDETKSFD